jgi:dipeptidyl aminopeptidase/acylaminoacyl peptidase
VLFGARQEPDDYASPPILTRLDLDSGQQTPLTPEWDSSPASWQVDGDRALVVAEDRARMRVFALELSGGASTPLTELADGSVSSPTVAGDRILALRQSIARPAELVALGREKASGVEPVHDPNAERLAELELNAPEELSVEGARGDEVQVFVLRPPGAPPREESGPLPLVHMIHGGPHGTFGDVWHYRWNAQAFAAPGFLVAMVNFHGSTSFGHEKTRSIQGAWGDMPFTDIEAATDVLVERGDANPARMAITGGSYGGYLAAWIPTRTSRYRCAVAHAAVTNLGAMLATDWPVGLPRAYGADPVTDPAAVARWSPAHHFAEHETPTLVIHGEKDYRVPYTQGLELYAALRSKGVPARLVVFPDENHWILAPANARRWYGEVQTWLERHLFPNRHP